MQIDEGLIRHWANLFESRDAEENGGTPSTQEENEREAARALAKGVWYAHIEAGYNPPIDAPRGQTIFPLNDEFDNECGTVTVTCRGEASAAEIFDFRSEEYDDNIRNAEEQFVGQMRNKVVVHQSEVGDSALDLSIKKGKYSFRTEDGDAEVVVDLDRDFECSYGQAASNRKLRLKLAKDLPSRKPNLPMESDDVDEGIGTATDRDGNLVKTINGDSNEEYVARSAAAGVMWLVKDNYDNGPSRGKDDGRTAEFDLSFGPYENVGHVRFNLHGHYLFSAIDELVQYPNMDEWEDNVDRFSDEFRNKVRLVGPNDDVVVMKGTYGIRLGCGVDMIVELTKEFRTGDENSFEHKDKVKSARDEVRYSKPDIP